MFMRFGSGGVHLQTKLKYVDVDVWVGALQEEEDTDSHLYNSTIIKDSSFRPWATIYFFTPKDLNASVLCTFIFFLSLPNFQCLLISPKFIFLVPSFTKSMFLIIFHQPKYSCFSLKPISSSHSLSRGFRCSVVCLELIFNFSQTRHRC